jgi:hypothetical protein
VINEAEKERARILRATAVADIFQRVADLMEDSGQKTRFLQEAARIRYQLEVAGMKMQLELLHAQNVLVGKSYDDLKRAIDGLPPLPPGYRGDNDDKDDDRPPVNRGEIAVRMRGLFDPTAGLRNQFLDLGDDVKDFEKQLRAAGLPTAELNKLLARLAQQTEAAKQQMAQLAIADLFEGIAGYMDEGAEKTEFLNRAAEIRFQIELAQMKAQLAFLEAEGYLVGENLELVKKGIAFIEDWEPPPYVPPPPPPAGGGGAGSGIEPPTLEDYEAFVASLNAMIAGAGQSGWAGQIASLNAEFEELRRQALEEWPAHMAQLGPLIDQAYAARLRAIWEQILQPIDDFLKGLDTSELSPLTARERIASLEDQFAAAVAAAQGGDLEAYAQAASLAQQLLAQGQDFYASGSDYNALYTSVVSALQALQAGAGGIVTPGGLQDVGGSGLAALMDALQGPQQDVLSGLLASSQDLGDLMASASTSFASTAAEMARPDFGGRQVTAKIDFGPLLTAAERHAAIAHEDAEVAHLDARDVQRRLEAIESAITGLRGDGRPRPAAGRFSEVRR